MKKGLLVFSVLGFVCCGNVASAANVTYALPVITHITDECVFSTSPTALAFAAYTGAQLDATTSFGVTCNSGDIYIALNEGTYNNLGPPITRRMQSVVTSGQYLTYKLYKTSGYTLEWGDSTTNTAGTTQHLSSLVPGVEQTLTIYGRIDAGQTPTAIGPYTDTVTITVSASTL